MERYDNYDAFNLELVRVFTAEDFLAAWDLAQAHRLVFPEQRAELDYMRMCIAVRIEAIEQAYEIFEMALNDGLWWSEELLLNSPSLLPLVGQQRFEDMVARADQTGRVELALLDPLIVASPEDTPEPWPLLVGLHDNSSRAEAARADWEPLRSAGVALALPQAREALLSGAYAWDNFDRTAPYVEGLIDDLIASQPVDAGQIVLGGHGMGAQLAIWLAISSRRAYRAFVAVAPFLSWLELDWWAEQIAGLQRPDLRGLILYGEADESLAPEALQMLSERLASAGSLCRVQAVAGQGHGFNPAFQQRIVAHWGWLRGAE